jgi:hypothetical protein
MRSGGLREVRSCACEEPGALTIGEEATVPNPHESTGESVKEEATRECVRRHLEEGSSIAAAPIAEAEGHLTVAESNDALVANSYPV